jgi:hypothetical protein
MKMEGNRFVIHARAGRDSGSGSRAYQRDKGSFYVEDNCPYHSPHHSLHFVIRIIHKVLSNSQLPQSKPIPSTPTKQQLGFCQVDSSNTPLYLNLPKEARR